MGYMRHHAIVVTSWSETEIKYAHSKASEIFPAVSGILPSAMNGYCSFLVPPDGSKEGWDDSDQGDVSRAQFKAWLNEQAHDDGSSSLHWVEVFYGDEPEDIGVSDSSNKFYAEFEEDES